jgi:hypothetical protein
MDSDGPGVGELFIFAMTGETEIVVVIGFGQLGSTGPPMGIMAIKAEDPCIEMTALLKIEPLLVMRFRVGLRISPQSRLKLIILGQGLSYPIRLVIFVIPGKLESFIRDTYPPRMALAANLQAPFVLQFSGMDDFPLGPRRLDVLGAGAMAFLASNIELDILRLIP